MIFHWLTEAERVRQSADETLPPSLTHHCTDCTGFPPLWVRAIFRHVQLWSTSALVISPHITTLTSLNLTEPAQNVEKLRVQTWPVCAGPDWESTDSQGRNPNYHLTLINQSELRWLRNNSYFVVWGDQVWPHDTLMNVNHSNQTLSSPTGLDWSVIRNCSYCSARPSVHVKPC